MHFLYLKTQNYIYYFCAYPNLIGTLQLGTILHVHFSSSFPENPNITIELTKKLKCGKIYTHVTLTHQFTTICFSSKNIRLT